MRNESIKGCHPDSGSCSIEETRAKGCCPTAAGNSRICADGERYVKRQMACPRCIFRLKNGLLELESIFPYTTLQEVKENTGWSINQTDVQVYPAPTAEELSALAEVDPNGIRNIEF